jgi:DNA invertase Pin-like site-specific DNA recombinase
MKNVIELVRVSTEGQAIPAQRTANQRTAAQHQLTIVRSIEISDVSGASVLKAPEIQELIKLMHSPYIHGVVTREFSRLMRPENFADYALLQVFVDTKTVLYLPDGPLDLASKTGRLLGALRAAMAGAERTDILERIWTAKEEKRRRGELAQSTIVLPHYVGYEDGRGFFYEPEAVRVREAFRQFLAGNQSYAQLSKLVGVTPRGMHLMFRNPIWTGIRVIDEKRDTSAAGRYSGLNGRQADRRKIARAPDEVIRIRVINEPMISEVDFQAVQHIMDSKQMKHWRSRTDYEHRFTYNGFLTCSQCGGLVHTALARRDYYACKNRRTTHTCTTKYMRRERLEAILDELFSQRLTSPAFVGRCVREFIRRSGTKDSIIRVQRLTSGIAKLQQKRERVIEGFLDGVLSREARDKRLTTIDHDLHIAQKTLVQEKPPASVDPATLAGILTPLSDWRFWNRDQKRTLLAALVPDVRVADYNVEALGVDPAIFSNEETHRDKGSWPRQA